jgi:hypothetical protein
MRQSLLCGALFTIAVVVGAATPETEMSASPARRSAVAYFTEPTLVGATFVVGPVMITHDDERMARGEPCTVIRLFDPARNRATETIAEFHCIPRHGTTVRRLTLTTRPSPYGFGCELTSYQFANDPEIHGVPLPAAAH